MPVIGRRNHDRVDILPREQLSKVFVNCAAFEISTALFGVKLFNDAFVILPPCGVDVTDSNYFCIRLFEEGSHQAS